jgi:RNA polymerase sigma-70 factor (ECF subfamily)
MADQETFTALVQRVRAGDAQAAAELVRQYEPFIRREVRMHLEDRRLRRVLDSLDVCQSVLGSFFVRAATGQYDLRQPGQLVKLLVTMARNKVASAAREQRQQKRDQRKVTAGDSALREVAGADPTPSKQVAGKELLERVRAELTPEENELADLRSQGLSWEDIAERLGGKAQARRMQLARALDRAGRAIGLEETHD